MANTPAVDEWLQKTNDLNVTAIALASGRNITAEEASMMRQIVSAARGLITVLQLLPPEAPPPPPEMPPGATGATGG